MTGGAFPTITQDNVLQAFHHAMGLQSEGRHAEAVELWDRIAAAAPMSAEARFNFGVSLFDLERFDDAETALRRAVEMKPDAAWTHLRLANVLHAVGRWREAEASYVKALSLDPNSHRAQLDLGHLYLGLGDYPRGWPLYEARKQVPGQNADPLPLDGEWQGEPLAGKSVLVWPEQGFGDQIQFARFLPLLAARGADITLVAPPELLAIFSGLGVRTLEHTPEISIAVPDHWMLICSIPHRLGVTLDTLPSAPYLQPPPDRIARWAGHAPKGAVGVLWQGRATPNPHRSLPSRDVLQPLADAGATLVDLQPPSGDFADTAAIIEQLDLVVTIDTAAAHLAGALGKPTFVLLPWFKTDWRWMQDRTDSPWYPSMRLFRQPTHGDWRTPIEQVVAAWREMG
jgi:Flp pilus assembly protein TadD